MTIRRFKPRKYKNLTRETLEAFRSDGIGVRKIGKHFGAHPTTVRNWLIRFNLPTERCMDARVSIHADATDVPNLEQTQ